MRRHHIEISDRGVAMEVLIIMGVLKAGVLGAVGAGGVFIWRLLAEAEAIERGAGRRDDLIWGNLDD